jgi:hypothetical protein
MLPSAVLGGSSGEEETLRQTLGQRRPDEQVVRLSTQAPHVVRPTNVIDLLRMTNLIAVYSPRLNNVRLAMPSWVL